MDGQPDKEFVQQLLKHQRQLYSYIAGLLPYGDDADEIYQQTCLILWQKWERFDQTSKFLTLACGIAYNEMRNHLRKKGRNPYTLSQELLEQISERRLEQQTERAQRISAVSECLDELSEADRTLIQAIYSDDRSTKEIAEDRDVTLGSLYTKAHRIRHRLMECVDRVLARGVES